jgi:hypothetical protein
MFASINGGHTCVSGVHEQTNTVVYEVGEQRGAVTHSVTCSPEVEINQRAPPEKFRAGSTPSWALTVALFMNVSTQLSSS